MARRRWTLPRIEKAWLGGKPIRRFCRTIALRDKIFSEFTQSEKTIQPGGWAMCRITTSWIYNANELRRNKGLRRRLSVLLLGLLRTNLKQIQTIIQWNIEKNWMTWIPHRRRRSSKVQWNQPRGYRPRNLVAMSDSEEEDWRFFQSYVSKVRIKLGPRRGLSEVRIRSASQSRKKVRIKSLFGKTYLLGDFQGPMDPWVKAIP